MSYVRNGQSIPDDAKWEQVFAYQPAYYSTGVASKTLELRSKVVINDMDVEIVKFLYYLSMARLDQVCKAIGVGDQVLVANRINKLVSQRILNKFTISDDKDAPQNDALYIYCFDTGGIPLIKHYTNDENTLSWSIEKIIMPALKVNKRLMAVDVFLRLRENPAVSFYLCDPLFLLGRHKCKLDAQFEIGNSDNKRQFLFETYREEEFLYSSGDVNYRVNRYCSVSHDAVWSKVFKADKRPIYIALCDTYNCAIEVAKVCVAADVPDFRILCLETMLSKPMSKSFYKAVEENNMVTIKPVEIKVF